MVDGVDAAQLATSNNLNYIKPGAMPGFSLYLLKSLQFYFSYNPASLGSSAQKHIKFKMQNSK